MTTDQDQAGRSSARDRAVEMRSEPLHRTLATPQPNRPMPSDFSVSLAARRAADQTILKPGGERRQPMRGYEETFTDIVDYILRCTHRIWDEKSIGYLYEHYRSNTRVVDDGGIVYGRDHVIEATTQFLGAFPDLRLHADEIVWCGDDELGFWTSHRVVLTGHNTGWSRWGPPTGRKIALTCMANCYSIENQIADEFVIYNTSSLLRQLGFDLARMARRVAAERLPELEREQAGEVERLLGQGTPMPVDPPPAGDGFSIAYFVRRTLHELWNWRLLDRIEDAYAAGFRFHGPTDRELYGRGAYTGYVLSMLSMLPDLAHQVDDLYWMGNDTDGYLVAVRWSILGTHRGHGTYGPPSGRAVRMWGITHLLVREQQILEEWTVANEFDVLVQLQPRPERANDGI